MRKFFVLLAAAVMAVSMMAQTESDAPKRNKMSFVVKGPERVYNQIRVVNHTHQDNFSCRVVFLNDDNTIREQYGVYQLKGYEDSDSNSIDVHRGERIGIQLQKDFPIEVSFDVEYKDYPFFDAILIHINELGTGFDDQF